MEEEKQWVYHEDEEEEEIGAALVGRKSRNQNKTNPSIANDSSESSVSLSESGNGFDVESITKEDIQEVVEERNGKEEETEEETQSNNNGNIVDVERGNEERKLEETSVYFDKQTGDESSSVFSDIKYDSVECSIPETNPGDDASEIIVNTLEAQNGTGAATTHQDSEYLDDKIFHDFIFLSSEVSRGMHIFDPKSLGKGQVEHENSLNKENGSEIAEFDVEKVLEKQNTHDLYCPNCNSCITRRVILRKRKRRVQDIHFGLKRERPEPLIYPKVEPIPADVTTDQNINAADVSLDGNSANATNENNQVREREAFRCLSCFTIFIPTGSGFKLFRCFGDKNEDKNIMSEQRPGSIFHYFFSRFQSDNGKMASKQGSHMHSLQPTELPVPQKPEVKGVQVQKGYLSASDQNVSVTYQKVPVGLSVTEIITSEDDKGKKGSHMHSLQPTELPVPQKPEAKGVQVQKDSFSASDQNVSITYQKVPAGLSVTEIIASEDDKGNKELPVPQKPETKGVQVLKDSLSACDQNVSVTYQKVPAGVSVTEIITAEDDKELPVPQKPEAKGVQVQKDSLSASDQNVSVTYQKVPAGLSVTEIITSEDDKGNKELPVPQKPEAKGVQVQKDSLSVSDQNVSVTYQKVPAGLSVTEIITSEDDKGNKELPVPQKPEAKGVQVQKDSLFASDQNVSVTYQKVPVGLSVTEIITSEDDKGNKELPVPQKPEAKGVQVQKDSLSASDQNVSVTYQKVPAGLSVTEIITSEDDKGNKGKDVVLIIDTSRGTVEASQRAEDSATPEVGNVPSALIHMDEHAEAREMQGFDILKSLVYGGLLESITSVGIVLSSAGADASTLNIMALGLANLLAGLLLIGHNLKELKNDQTRTTSNEQDGQVDKYQETLGRRENFILHAVVVVLSFIIFGLVPLVTYGLLFRKSNSDKDYKLLAVFGAAFVCIIALAVGKAHVQKPPKTYIKTVMYYAALAVSGSGVSYIVGELIQELLNKLGWFASSASMNMPYLGSGVMKQPLLSSY